MATSNSLGAISRRLCRSILSNRKPSISQHYHHHHHHMNKSSSFSFSFSFSTTGPTTLNAPEFSELDVDELPLVSSDSDSSDDSLPKNPPSSPPSEPSSSPSEHRRQGGVSDYSLEGGLDVGIYKAILVGQVGQNPLQKRLKNGRVVTLTTIGTGGIRNERIPFPNEEPREYADRCNVQWHRVAIYPERLGEIVMKHGQPGVILYLEGNLETKIFTDQVTGLVKRVREVAVRRNGRVVFLGNGSDFNQPSQSELRGVGYF